METPNEIPDSSRMQTPTQAGMDQGTVSSRPGAGGSKAVSIAEPESISPLPKGKFKEVDVDGENSKLDSTQPRKYKAKVAKSPFGPPSSERLTSSERLSLQRQSSSDKLLAEAISSSGGHGRHGSRHRHHEGLFSQIHAWVQGEKSRRAGRRSNRKAAKESKGGPSADQLTTPIDSTTEGQQRRASDASDSSLALEKLQEILEKANLGGSNIAPSLSRKASRKMSSRKLRRHSTAQSSDTDNPENDPLVPTVEAVLDNSKTMAYSGGGAESEGESDGRPPLNRKKSSYKEKDAWKTFKFEIVRLAHTLRLHGWRKVPMEQSDEIEVERLSGALTNAVYVVSPPKNLKSSETGKAESQTSLAPKKPPPKLLLRIYGPQVEHLIDREAELQILRRLARKRIGPRLLGTFTNGRFEEFFHAITLTPKDLRDPDTSKQIAKRMRELHEGVELLPKERVAGAFVWQNWNKWVDRCEQVISWLDERIIKEEPIKSKDEAWKQRGLVCGVEWPVFRQTVEKYRKWLDEQYGGSDKVKDNLVFAHNDTQYGNILRLVPPGESPLMLPANKHKQLVVIDFEYANANLVGLEFANHFTEWCYNYHDADRPFACNDHAYPTPEEQRRFIRAYIVHRPFQPKSHNSTGTADPSASASRNPSLPPTPGLPPAQSSLSSSAISSFMLDSRYPPSAKDKSEQEAAQAREKEEEERVQAEVERLMAETRLWRLANTAQWVAWGIVQAKVPGLEAWDDKDSTEGSNDGGKDEPPAEKEDGDQAEKKATADGPEEKGSEDAEDAEFDYLAYAQERAMFFWGDAIALGIVKKEELPTEMLKKVKTVEY